MQPLDTAKSMTCESGTEASDSMDKRRASKVDILLYILSGGTIISLVVCIGLLSWVPPVSRDALTHHLLVPKIYLQHGKMVELPHIGFSYYPMNLDLLYILPLYFGNDILPKFIHFTFGLLTAGLIFGFLKKRFNVTYALLGVLMFLSMPVIIKLSTTVYVDLGLVFFTTAALFHLIKWHESRYVTKYLLVSAVFCGLALGTKYNGLVTFFILSVFVPVVYLRSHPKGSAAQGRAVGWAVAYALVALLIFSPWMIRNVYWTGNPVFPLYNRIFRTASAATQKPLPAEVRQEIEARTGDWNHIAVRRIVYKESWGEIALVPLRIFFQGKDDDPKYFDGKLNPFLLLLPIFAFFPRRKDLPIGHFERKLLLYFVLLFLLISFLRTSIRIRYIVPVLPALIILSVAGFHNLVGILKTVRTPLAVRCGTTIAATIVLLLFGMNTIYLVDQFKLVDPFSYLSGKLDRETYITRFRSEYPVMKYANIHLTGGSKILGLYLGNRRYYCDRDIISGEDILTRAVLLASGVDEVRQSLVDRGFTHVMANLDLVRQWVATLNGRERSIAVGFINQCLKALDTNRSYVLYELKSLPVDNQNIVVETHG